MSESDLIITTKNDELLTENSTALNNCSTSLYDCNGQQSSHVFNIERFVLGLIVTLVMIFLAPLALLLLLCCCGFACGGNFKFQLLNYQEIQIHSVVPNVKAL